MSASKAEGCYADFVLFDDNIMTIKVAFRRPLAAGANAQKGIVQVITNKIYD